MQPLIASGRAADVYADEPGRVRRRYRDARNAEPEARMMRWLAEASYPVPTVHAAVGPDLVMDRIEGPTMAACLFAGQVTAADAGRLLADLHNRLHGLDHPDAVDGQRVVHLDLHPLNVLMPASGAVVIDWSQAGLDDPSVDVAMTVVILAQAATVLPQELADVDPAYLRRELAALLRTFLIVVHDEPWPALQRAVELRRSDPNLADTERVALDDAVRWARSLVPAD